MKKLICLSAGALLLTGCAVTPIPPGPGPGPVARTCVVSDATGRTWNWTGTVQPCVQAVRACNRWHANRRMRSWHCSITKVY